MPVENLRTVKQLCEECPVFTESGLRALIFHAETNGLARALVRVGRRVLIDKEAFEAWIEEGRGREVESGRRW